MYSDKLAARNGHEIREGQFRLVEICPSSSSGESRILPGSDSVLKDYWQILRRRKWTIFLFAGIVLGIVGIASMLMTPQYQAVGSISIGRENTDLLGLKEGTLDYSGDNAEYNMYLEAQV